MWPIDQSSLSSPSRLFGGNAKPVSFSIPITPTFVLPYKRYASTQLLQLASHYLDNDQISLRDTTSSRGNCWVYRDSPEASALSHTTLYRMLLYLGAMTITLSIGIDLFLQADPASSIHRFDGPVASSKARSKSRLQSLSIARRLLYLRSRWDSRFKNGPFFPRFATRCRSP